MLNPTVICFFIWAGICIALLWYSVFQFGKHDNLPKPKQKRSKHLLRGNISGFMFLVCMVIGVLLFVRFIDFTK